MLSVVVAMSLMLSDADAGEASSVDAGADQQVDTNASAPDAGGFEIADAGVEVSRETKVHDSRLVDPRRIAGSAQVIGHEELERQENNDIHKVLGGVPGVYVREEDGFGLRPNIGLRGVNADRSSKITLMEDGVLLGPAPYSAAAAYYFPAVTRMVGVEVYKGPASIRYGPQTVGGAVNLRTREIPDGFASDIDLSAGNFGSKKFHGWIGTGDENMGFLIEGVSLSTDGFKVIDGGGPTGFLKGELMAKGKLFTDSSRWWRTGVELKLGVATENSHETYQGITDADFKASPYRRYSSTANDDMQWLRTQIEVTHVLTLGEKFTLRTTAYRHDLDRDWHRMQQFRTGPELYDLLTNPTANTQQYLEILRGERDSVGADQQLMQAFNHRIFYAQGIQTTANLQVDTGPVRHDLEVGLRLHADQIHRVHSQLAYDTRDGAIVASGDPFFVLRNFDSTTAFAAYASDTLTWGHLLVSPGIRVETIRVSELDEDTRARSSATSVAPLLGIGAVYTFTPGFSILGGVHQGFSPVSPGQDASVLPERAINSELGARLTGKGLKLETIGFWSEYQNITGECTGSTGCVGDEANRQFNGGRARVLGLEVLANGKLQVTPDTALAADLTYTLSHATFLTDFTSDNGLWGSVQPGDFLPYVPLHQAQLRVRASYKSLEVGVGANWYGAMREVAGQGTPLENVSIPDRVTMDATASYQLNALRLYFTANNLLNTAAIVSRRPFGARPQAPMIFQIGVKYEFR